MAILIVVALLTLGLGWREALIVAVAVPVVFGLTLAVNLMLGFTINRVTLFALILSLGLLVDDPIVDVENIVRHFALRKKATRRIVLEAVAEIRPPLITATLAVIVSFLPMFFITGMMGPYMRPMALNVPVTMLMSMVVAFTITPWLAYHVLQAEIQRSGGHAAAPCDDHRHDPHDLDAVKQSRLYKVFYPLMAPLLHSRLVAWCVPARHGPADGRGDGTGGHAQRAAEDAAVRQQERIAAGAGLRQGHHTGTLRRRRARLRGLLAGVPEVADYTSYVGLASPMDFNGLVRHYYLRQGDDVAEVRINLAGKKNRDAAEPRHRSADAERPAGDRRSAPRPHEARGDAARAAGDRQRGGRGLRPAGPSLRRPPAGGRHRAGASGGRAGRGRCRRRARSRRSRSSPS